MKDLGLVRTWLPGVLFALTASVPASIAGTGDGWTALTPSADSRIVYVSSSAGNDASGQWYAPSDLAIGPDPTHPVGSIQPYQTVAAAKSQLRSGKPDWILLRRGDTWTESLGSWTKSGRAAGEPMVVGSYGEVLARPKLLTGSQYALQTYSDPPVPVDYLAIVGLSFEPHTRPASAGPNGIQWYTPTNGFLVEDCSITGYSKNIMFDQYPGADQIKNVTIRRNVIVDAWDLSVHPQGMYADDTDGVLIEENVFDHNGWNEDVAGAVSEIYNHNIYMQNGARNVVVRGNIISQGSNHGLQLRRGGVVEGNLFVRNVVALLLGGGDDPTPGGVTATALGNVILEGYGAMHFPAGGGWGIDLKNIASGLIQGNIVANNSSAASNAFSIGSYVSGGPAGVGVDNTDVIENIIYNWRGPIQLPSSGSTGVEINGNAVQDPGSATVLPLMNSSSVSPSVASFSGNTYYSARPLSQWFLVGGTFYSFTWWKSNAEPSAVQQLVAYPDPDRTTGSYAATLGLPATADAFIAQARQQSHHFWRPEYTAAAVVTYVRAGFGLEPAPSCPGDLDQNDAVDSSDLLGLLEAWGPNPGHPADLDGDGVVDSPDLLALLGNWGPCS